MTKKEIVKTISDDCGLTQLKTKEIVQKTFEAIIETLLQDSRHRIELRNFGVFEVKKRAARKARNPRTGDRVEVPAKFVVTFKPGKEMEEKVLQLEQQEFEKERRQAEANRVATTGSTFNAGPSKVSAANANASPTKSAVHQEGGAKEVAAS